MQELSPHILAAADSLWAYHHVSADLLPADIIFVLGSNDSRVAAYAAELYHRGLAPRIIFSGGVGRFTDGWTLSEAESFASIARAAGVPDEAILCECKARNTGENVRFSQQILLDEGYGLNLRVIALQKPYMERRTLATLEQQWPECRLQVSSPPCSFSAYLSPELSASFVLNAMVGDFQRILHYPSLGFSTPQPVTQEALDAFLQLVEKGYDSQLIEGVALPH